MFERKAWFAVYSRSRAEKKVALELEYSEINYYLPLQRKLRTWSDRKKWVDFPLIPGYIFVNLAYNEFEKVYQVPGVLGFLRIEGRPAEIPECQIDSLRRLLRQNEVPYQVDYRLYKPGDEIEVVSGPLMGMKGNLVMVKGKKRVAVQLEQFSLSLLVEVPLVEIRKLEDVKQ